MAEWAIVDSGYDAICDFDAILSVDADESGRVPTEPMENGALAAYNKSIEPSRVNVTAAMSGDWTAQLQALSRLQELKDGTELLTIISPARVWRNMSLERFGYSRASGAGATLLAVDMAFVEVRSVTVSTTTYSPKNATSSDLVSTGKTQTTTTKPKDTAALQLYRSAS